MASNFCSWCGVPYSPETCRLTTSSDQKLNSIEANEKWMRTKMAMANKKTQLLYTYSSQWLVTIYATKTFHEFDAFYTIKTRKLTARDTFRKLCCKWVRSAKDCAFLILGTAIQASGLGRVSSAQAKAERCRPRSCRVMTTQCDVIWARFA